MSENGRQYCNQCYGTGKPHSDICRSARHHQGARIAALEQERDALRAKVEELARVINHNLEESRQLEGRHMAVWRDRDLLRTRLEAAVKVVGAVRRHAHSSDCGCDLCDALAEYDRLKK